VGALAQMQREGLIKMIGVSNVDVEELRAGSRSRVDGYRTRANRS